MSKETKEIVKETANEVAEPEVVTNEAAAPAVDSAQTKAQELDAKTLEYKAEVEKIDSLETLEEMEREVIEEIGKNDAYLAGNAYTLPESTEFKGTVYSRDKVCQMIFDLLNSQKVGWQMTLGLFEVMDYWKGLIKKKDAKIAYQYYDTTLRLLGQQQYGGYEQLRSILVANNFFSAAREEYLNDLAYTYFLANKHDALLQRMDAIRALTEPIKK